MLKAYAYIFTNYCSTSMQVNLKELPDFDLKVRNNPAVLLEKVQLLMHTPVRAVHPFISLIEAITRLLNLRQKENESLIDYLERFKQERNIASSQLGRGFLGSFVENTPEYIEADSLTRIEMKKTAFDQMMAIAFLRGSNQGDYGSIMEGFQTQYSLGNNQYPKTLLKATDVMRQVKIKKKKSSDKRGKGKQDKKKDNETKDDENATSFAQSNTNGRTCFCCGSDKHLADKCPMREDIARSQWNDRSKKVYTHLQNAEQSSADRSENGGTVNAPTVSWCGIQVSHAQSMHQRGNSPRHCDDNVIVLDNGSTVSIFKDMSLVSKITEAKTPMELGTNTGTKTINQNAMVPGHGEVKFGKDGIANIFAFSDMIKKGYRITIDTDVENAFLLDNGKQRIKFEANDEGLYIYKPSNGFLEKVAQERHANKLAGVSFNLKTLTNKKEGFNNRQVMRATRAREFYHQVGAPSIEMLKIAIRQNLFKNCPVTTEDIILADKLFGPDISTLKGKSTKASPAQVISDEIEVPDELLKIGCDFHQRHTYVDDY